MVKIPGLDDLKKMGSDLIDSAKTVNIGGVVDKIKGGMETVGMKKTAAPLAAGDDPLAQKLQDAYVVLNELVNAQAQQTQLIKKLQGQLIEMTTIAAAYQKPVVATETKPEENTK